VVADAAIWKAFGTASSEVWLVGSGGLSFLWDGNSLTQHDTGIGSQLFTVHGNGQRYAAVGGAGTGVVVENDGTGWVNALNGASPYALTGVALLDGDSGWAVGQYGLVMARNSDGWSEVATGLEIQRDLHAVWVDPGGGVWAVGGVVIATPQIEGLLLHRGDTISAQGL
jgi:hypothetical protein